MKKALSQLSEIRRLLEEPSTGLSALRSTLDQTRQKILEALIASTTGLREENQELRRRQDQMLNDLAGTRSSLDALRLRAEENTQTLLSRLTPPTTPDRQASSEPNQAETAATELVTADPDTAKPDTAEPAATEPATTEPPAEPAETTTTKGEDPQVRLLAEVRAAHYQANAAREDSASTTTDPVAAPVADRQDPLRTHLHLLLSAATIGSARLVCHRGTWDFIAKRTSGQAHFQHPERIAGTDDGCVDTTLSGTSLLAVLTAMWQVLLSHETDATTDDADLVAWAQAAAVYHRAALALDQVTYPSKKEDEPALIILDDRCTPAVQEDSSTDE